MKLSKYYEPQICEDRIYQRWLEKNYFHALVDPSKKPYTIVIPPPNITGMLHIGHASTNTLQDILIRYKRMDGYSALWLPGTDHASISTELKIVEEMALEGLKKEDVSREEFLKRAWKWKDKYGNIILEQFKKMGFSLDFSRLKFTLDEDLSQAVFTVFKYLYEKEYIYRAKKLINWCPVCKTTVSDAEVEHIEQQSKLYYIRYQIANANAYLTVATTRPETLFGDTAVMVHPNDERYKKYIGKHVVLPIANKIIPIIADEKVDPQYGTGVVKVTPAHDFNDFEVGQKHGLEMPILLDDEGFLNELTGKYQGLSVKDARKQVVEELKKSGCLEKIETITNSVGVHERCHSVIEPMLKQQWFVKMKDLAPAAIEAYQKENIQFVPDRFGKIYLQWLDNIRDWCISRQLYWGHRIPVYYCDCGNIELSNSSEVVCSQCKSKHLIQDEDVLDTWFSSALWPFTTLGWPQKTADYDYFYPTDVLVTGYDIIFFWVVRMVFSSLEYTGKIPFHTVLLNGLVKDEQGRKMSKSLGNGVDPLEIIEEYGADCLRFALMIGVAPGNDTRFKMEKVEQARNFTNKIWNAARFIQMNQQDLSFVLPDLASLKTMDRWVLSKYNQFLEEVKEKLDKFEIALALSKIYDFLWDEFCDWYIEMVKIRLKTEGEDKTVAVQVLNYIFLNSLKCLHVFMPFVTEEIFLQLQDKEESIMISEWPHSQVRFQFSREEKEIEFLKEITRRLRNLRTEMKLPVHKRFALEIVPLDDVAKEIFLSNQDLLKHMAYVTEIEFFEKSKIYGKDYVQIVSDKAYIYIRLADLMDIEKEKIRLQNEKEKLEKEREKFNLKLNNPAFMAKAPAQIVKDQRMKRDAIEEKIKAVEERMMGLDHS